MTSSDTAYQGVGGLEMVLHEALHTAEDSLVSTANRIAARIGRPVSYNVIHAAIFAVAGEAVHERMPSYRPYASRVGLIDGTRGLGPPLRLLSAASKEFLGGRLSLDQLLTRAIPD